MSSSEETPTKNITGDSNKKVMEQPFPFITVSPVQSTCKICNKTFITNRDNLRKHMTSTHSDDYSFPQWSGISAALSTKEQEAKSHWKSFVKRPFKFENRPHCNKCNKVFSRIDAFHRHLRDSSDGCNEGCKTMVRCVQLSCGGWYVIPPDDPLYHPTSTTPSASSSILPPCSLDLSARMPKGSNIKLSEYAAKLLPFIKPKYTAKSWPKVLMTLMNDDNFPNLSSIVDNIYHALKAPPQPLKTLIECCDYYITMLPTIINFLPGDVRSFLLNFKTKDYGYQDESEERASIFSERQSENQTKSYLHHLLAFLYTMKCPILDRYLNHINSDKWVSVEDSYEYAFFSSIVYDLSREAPRRFGTTTWLTLHAQIYCFQRQDQEIGRAHV